jgi:hypothetical protein
MLHPTLFIFHFLDQFRRYLVLLPLSINSLGFSGDVLSSVYDTFMCAQSHSEMKDIRISVPLSLWFLYPWNASLV